MMEGLEETYEADRQEYEKRRRYRDYAGLLVIILYGMAVAIPQIITVSGQNNSFAGAIFGFAFLASLVLLAIFMIKGRRKFAPQRNTTIKIYIAYSTTKQFLEKGITEKYRHPARRALKALLLDIGFWTNKKTPAFMAKPAVELNKVLKEKALPAIDSDDKTAIEATKSFLHDLLSTMGNNPAYAEIDPIIERLNLISISKRATERKLDIKGIIEKLRSLTQRKVIIGFLIFLGFLIFGFGWVYGVPVFYQNSAEKPSLDSLLNAFVAIIMTGAGIVAAYLLAPTLLRKDTTNTT
jgi:hypothetical protein